MYQQQKKHKAIVIWKFFLNLDKLFCQKKEASYKAVLNLTNENHFVHILWKNKTKEKQKNLGFTKEKVYFTVGVIFRDES